MPPFTVLFAFCERERNVFLFSSLAYPPKVTYKLTHLISIPHGAAEYGIENFEFIVTERVQVNPDNSQALSALTFFIIQIEYAANKNRHPLSQPKLCCNDSGV